MGNGYVLSVAIHVLSAVAWIGGMLFLTLVVVPVIRLPEHRSVAPSLIHQAGTRFRTVGWVCLSLLLLTGILNLAFLGYDWDEFVSGELWRGKFGRALSVKLALVTTILILSGIHDFYIGPRASALLRDDPTSPAAKRLRKTASWIGRVNLLLALAVLYLALTLHRGGI